LCGVYPEAEIFIVRMYQRINHSLGIGAKPPQLVGKVFGPLCSKAGKLPGTPIGGLRRKTGRR